MAAGRFAPSPSGDLHVGNLRTALLAWALARRSGRDFLMRVEDLDRVRPGAEQRQLGDLTRLGIDWDGPVTHQSERLDGYDAAIAQLQEAGLVYECFCTRREVLEAPSAPHQPPGAYPGTCRDLSESARRARRLERPAALRLRADVDASTVTDELHGEVTGPVDDVVLRRGDGVVAYNLAVVVDDAAQGIDQVVRGDDLLTSAPRQAHLATLLGAAPPSYVHVPLALNAAGQRLAKRDGAVTSAELRDRGVDVLGLIAGSLGLRASTAAGVLDELDLTRLPREPWVVLPPE